MADASAALPARADVAVIGAGIVGCVLALTLARRGVDVVVVDARGPARGATGRSAGFLIRGTADHLAHVAATLGRERALALWRYTEASLDALVHLAETEAIACGLRREGGLVLALDADEARALDASSALLGGWGDLWSGAEVERRTGLREFAGGWFRPGDGTVDPARLCRGLAERAVAAGARLVAGVTVKGVEERGPHQPVVVRTDRGDMDADRAVLAVNAGAADLEARLGGFLYPVRAQMMATAPAPPDLRLPPWPVYAHDGFEYWRQEPNGELLFGGARWAATPDLECGVRDDGCVSDVVFAAQRAFLARHLPRFAALPVAARWTGIMAFTRDGLPLVGPVPGSARQLVCAGWNGHGLALGPLSAQLIAATLLGERPALPVDFAPARIGSA